MDTLLVVAAGFFLVAAICGFMASAMKGESFSRNRAVGIRTKATLASDEAWAKGHLASAPWVFSSSIAGLISGVASLVLAGAGAGDSNVLVAAIIIAGFGSVIGLLIVSAVVANRAASSVTS